MDYVFTINEFLTVKCPSERAGSDVTLIVEEHRFQCHKKKLAEMSPYFQILFYGPMKESKQSEIELHAVSVEAFAVLLIYIYDAELNLERLTVDLVLEFFHLAILFTFDPVAHAIEEHLKLILNLENFSIIYDWSKLYDRRALAKFCLRYSDAHSNEILKLDAVKNYSASTLKDVLSRDLFFENEIDIFTLLTQLLDHRGVEMKELLEVVRLPLINAVDLQELVLPTRLFSLTQIMQARDIFYSSKNDLQFRGCLIPGENVASEEFNVRVLQEMDFKNVDWKKTSDFEKKGYAKQEIDNHDNDWCTKGGILIKLDKLYFVNCIEMLIKKQDDSQYSYFIEVFNDHKWSIVTDHKDELSNSGQVTIDFPTKAIKFIRIVATPYNNDKNFAFEKFKCYYKKKRPDGNTANDDDNKNMDDNN